MKGRVHFANKVAWKGKSLGTSQQSINTRQDSTLAYYEANAAAIAFRYEEAQMHNLHSRLIDYLSGCSKLLELGCGSGRDASFLKANGFFVIALDGSPAMLCRALNLHPELDGFLLNCVLPCNLPFRNESFGGIYSIASLMHLGPTALDQTLAEVTRILAPGGYFVFSTPLYRGDLDPDGRDKEGRFFCLMSAADWQRACSLHDLSILETSITADGLSRNEVQWFTGIARRHD